MTDHEEDVEALVERARDGDRAALAELYDRLAGRVYRFALFRVGSRADAEDLMQRTFVKMIETLPRYQQRGIPFEAWFFRLARNAVIDHLRRRRTHEPLAAVVNTEDAGPSPEDAAELNAEFQRIREAIETLTPIQQEVIAYRFTAGLTPRQVGALLGKREGTVRALQFRALRTLRRSLDRAAPLDAPMPNTVAEAELE
jgi:RNA polymerase sigma-70 factor (ECF subfamily)